MKKNRKKVVTGLRYSTYEALTNTLPTPTTVGVGRVLVGS